MTSGKTLALRSLAWFSLRTQAAQGERGRIQASLARQKAALRGRQACPGMSGPRTVNKGQSPTWGQGAAPRRQACDLRQSPQTREGSTVRGALPGDNPRSILEEPDISVASACSWSLCSVLQPCQRRRGARSLGSPGVGGCVRPAQGL